MALLATGGSTNHTMHLVAMAAAAGIHLTWRDFAELSQVVPLLARIYPNGSADINQFHEAGGTASLFSALLEVGLLHEDVLTVVGEGLSRYTHEPELVEGELIYGEAPAAGSVDPAVLRSPDHPFAEDGGIRVLEGSLGRGVIKVSAVSGREPHHRGARAGVRRPGALPRCVRRMATATTTIVVVVSASRDRRPTACPSCTG